MNYEHIPSELKQLNQWVVWGVDKAKPKMPYSPVTMRPAKAGVPRTWGSYTQAVQRVESGEVGGIGFEFNNNGYYGIDLDHVLTDGKLTPEATKILNLLNSYTEISPSGTGLHIIVKAEHIELEVNRKGFIEIYNQGRYFTMTGNIFKGAGL